MTEGLITSQGSRHPGIMTREVEVVVTIIIEIPGTTTEITVAAEGGIHITTEDADQEVDSVVVDTGTIETEGKALVCCS